METDSAAPWTVDAAVSHDGVSSVRSGAIGNNGMTYLMASVKKAGMVSFWWKAQCEDPDEEDGEDGYYDYGAFLVDDVVKARIAGNDTGWRFVSVEVPTGGKHVLRWEYRKDGATSYAPDCVWVDQVQWSPADGSGYTLTSPEPVPYSWLRQYNLGVASGDFEAAASGSIRPTRSTASSRSRSRCRRRLCDAIWLTHNLQIVGQPISLDFYALQYALQYAALRPAPPLPCGEGRIMVLYQPSAKIREMPTKSKMLYSFAECKRKFGSPYQIDKAIADGRIWKIGVGVYSDTGEENELEIVQWRHPNAVMTLDSAFFYYDLTDTVPDLYYMATDHGARPIVDPLVKQFYLPAGTAKIGVTTIDYCGDKVRTFDLERLLIETVRMKGKIAPDMYKEVVLSFRRRTSELKAYKIADYLVHFAKRDAIESILYQEIF